MNYPSLKDWLAGIKLEAEYDSFVGAGWEDYESLLI